MTTPGESPRLTAGIYCRISLARDGDTTKTADQERICRDLAEARGLAVGDDHAYVDNSRSAWQRDRRRPGWDRMLADVEAGRLGAIIVYHGDRLIRQPWDLERLLALADSKGIRLLSPTGTRNLDNADDRFILRIEAAQACRESDNLSRRQKARYERDRRNGKIMSQGPGGRRFGLCSDGETLFPADRCELETRREVSEADVIREAAARILAGEWAGAIEADLRRRGWTTPAGAAIQHGTLRRWLRNPRYAGLMPDGETRAAWPAILDRGDWERVRYVLEQRAALYPRDHGNGARHLLSGIAECGGDGCGQPMMAAYVSSRGYKSLLYGCEKRRGGCGRVFRNAAHLDAYVGAQVVGYLANPLHPGGRPPAEDHAAEWAILQRERASTEAKLRDYRTSAGMLDVYASRIDSIDARMAELRARDAGDSRARLLERYAGIGRREWEALDLGVRRSLVSACFRVTVLPASGRGPGFRTQDVRVEPLG